MCLHVSDPGYDCLYDYSWMTTAPVPQECYECGCEIPSGEQHHFRLSRWGGFPAERFRTCAACFELISVFGSKGCILGEVRPGLEQCAVEDEIALGDLDKLTFPENRAFIVSLLDETNEELFGEVEAV